MTPSRRRSRSCMPQKQPPARIAVSVLSVIGAPSLDVALPTWARVADRLGGLGCRRSGTAARGEGVRRRGRRRGGLGECRQEGGGGGRVGRLAVGRGVDMA